MSRPVPEELVQLRLALDDPESLTEGAKSSSKPVDKQALTRLESQGELDWLDDYVGGVELF